MWQRVIFTCAALLWVTHAFAQRVTEDNRVAPGQPGDPTVSRTYVYDGSLWRRVVFGQATAANSLPVVLASDQTIPVSFTTPFGVTQSGTWTVQPGNTANTTAWLVTGTGGTFPVTGTFWQTTQPISGTVTANAGTGTLAVSGPLTDTQLRATAVPISGTVTANAGSGTLAVSGPLTDTQLRATAVPISGTVTANAGSGTLAVSGPLTDTQLRATAVPVSGTVTVGTFPDNEPVNLAQVAGTVVSVNNGTADAGTTRVTLASDSTGEVRVADDAGNQIPSSTASPAETARGFNVRPVHDDPCKNGLATPLPINLTADTQLVAAVVGQHVYLCQFQIFVAAANNLSVISGTGTICATSTAGVLGGATAATGWNFIANQGIVVGTGDRMIGRTETAGDALCIDVSAASQTSGSITYVQQ